MFVLSGVIEILDEVILKMIKFIVFFMFFY